MPRKKQKHIVFDIVGTCVNYEVFFNALEERLGSKLRAYGIDPRLFGMLWMADAERECIFLNTAGITTRFIDIFKPFIFRYLAMCGIKDPRTFCSNDDAEYVASSYRRLRAREGVHECFRKLREAGFEVWALTSGDKVRVQSYLEESRIEMPEDRLVACEFIGATKPENAVYEHMLKKFSGADEKWFAAAHMWDSVAARQSGFKAAWCAAWEKEPVVEVFGEVEVMADDLVTLAEKVIAASA